MKKKKTTPQPRNHLVRLVMFRKAGAHRKTNKALRRLEKSKKLFPIIYNFDFLYIWHFLDDFLHLTCMLQVKKA